MFRHILAVGGADSGPRREMGTRLVEAHYLAVHPEREPPLAEPFKTVATAQEFDSEQLCADVVIAPPDHVCAGIIALCGGLAWVAGLVRVGYSSGRNGFGGQPGRQSRWLLAYLPRA